MIEASTTTRDDPAPCKCCASYGAYMIEHNVPVCVICVKDGLEYPDCAVCCWGSHFVERLRPKG